MPVGVDVPGGATARRASDVFDPVAEPGAGPSCDKGGGLKHSAAAPASTTNLEVQITIPVGVQAGQKLRVQAPDGRSFDATVPAGLGPGSTLRVQVPQSAAGPVAVSAALPAGWTVHKSTELEHCGR